MGNSSNVSFDECVDDVCVRLGIICLRSNWFKSFVTRILTFKSNEARVVNVVILVHAIERASTNVRKSRGTNFRELKFTLEHSRTILCARVTRAICSTHVRQPNNFRPREFFLFCSVQLEFMISFFFYFFPGRRN